MMGFLNNPDSYRDGIATSLAKYNKLKIKIQISVFSSVSAIYKRKHQIGFCDIVESAEREKIDASYWA